MDKLGIVHANQISMGLNLLKIKGEVGTWKLV